jgi:hypothetical protein
MAKAKTKTFIVEGRGSFPADMLRYDSCWPASSQDASATAEGIMGGRRRVMLTTDNPYAPTIGRWNSFLWAVVEED